MFKRKPRTDISFKSKRNFLGGTFNTRIRVHHKHCDMALDILDTKVQFIEEAIDVIQAHFDRKI